MTEQEWLNYTDPQKMLDFLRGKVSERRFRLFACACCSIRWHLLADDRNRKAVELAECLADGAMERKELAAVRASTRDGTAWCTIMDSAWDAAAHAARSGASDAARSAIRGKAWSGREERDAAWWHARAAARLTQASVLREIFGNPFRPITLNSAWLPWHGGLLASMARQMYDGRDFSDMPVLADALEEAGCQNQDILAHCRSGGEHVRGCWVIDALLGKS